MAIIGVMGSGSHEWEALAGPLGAWLAQNGYDLLTGAGRGVMLSVSRAFSASPGRLGRCIGVIPSRADDAYGFVGLEGYPNRFVDLPILTPLPRKEPGAEPGALSRNHVNVLTSDVVIALPGGAGTLDEIALAQRYGKPVMCFGPADAFDRVAHGIEISGRLEDVTAFIRAQAAPAASAGIR